MGRSTDELRWLATSYRLSQVIYAVAALRIPDAIAGGCGTVDEIAAEIGAPRDATGRLLRAAASESVLAAEGDRYALNEFSGLLRSDLEGSLRDMLLGWSTMRTNYLAFGHLDDVIRTGRSGTEVAFGARFHELMRTRPDEAARYEAAMESTVDGFIDQARAYDFSAFDSIVDVGGGQGSFLVAILREHPSLADAVLFDLPDVVAGAPARLAAHPEGERIEIVAGDMFVDLPAGRDLYLFSTVLRCFTDDECLPVLERCRAAIKTGGRMLAVEMVMPDGVPPSPLALADLTALVVYGGRDRTRGEWTALLERAGFAAPRFIPVDPPFVIVEAEVA